MTPLLYEVLAGVGVGLAGGVTSGLLGVSPGGGLVVFAVLLLGAEQHVAQGTSLVAQVPPTSLSGIRRYRENGSRAPLRWLVWLAVGFLFGGVSGAFAARGTSSSALQWAYVIYLAALDMILIIRGNRQRDEDFDRAEKQIHWAPLLIVGGVAGFSSGFMGIGGGLAITVGLGAELGVPQRQAQLVSLVLSIIPTTIPAAWVYWSRGSLASWPALVGVLVGLWLGTDLGARMANRAGKTLLHRTSIAFISAMTIYMACKALA